MMKKKILSLGIIAVFMVMLVTLTGCGSNEKGTEKAGEGTDNSSISKSTEKADSYVGYYADIDGDGTVDGVIYADLVTGAKGNGVWNSNNDSSYTISTISSESAKDYYISQTNYEGTFGTKDVISPKGEGENRFYIMALTDVNQGKTYCWYQAAYYSGMSDYETYTSTDFGKGKENTQKMITKWNASGYGNQNGNKSYDDMWGVIQTEVEKGWFVPSKDEWSAFAGELGITKSNYDEFGLGRSYYWSSSQSNTDKAWYAIFNNGYMLPNELNWNCCVRLSSTF